MLPDLLDESGFNNLVKGRHGYLLYNRNDIVVGQSAKAYGEYFESEVDIFRRFVEPGHCVADIGANIGMHTLALARLVGEEGWVCAFEAQRVVFQCLCANVALNSLSNVDCEHLAVDEKVGSLLVEELDCTARNNFGGLSLGTSQAQRYVPSITLDDYFTGRTLDFAKVDVEGMEQSVLKGGWKTLKANKTILYLENDRVSKSPELLQYLFMLGYDVYWHLPHFFNPGNFAGESRELYSLGLVDNGGEFYDSIGFAINMLCIPKKRGLKVDWLLQAEDIEEHPLRRGPSRFHGLNPACSP